MNGIVRNFIFALALCLSAVAAKADREAVLGWADYLALGEQCLLDGQKGWDDGDIRVLMLILERAIGGNKSDAYAAAERYNDYSPLHSNDRKN